MLSIDKTPPRPAGLASAGPTGGGPELNRFETNAFARRRAGRPRPRQAAPTFRSALNDVPALVAQTIDDAFRHAAELDSYATAPHILSVGRGYNYATALEIALKVRELTTTIAEGFSAADLLHGPIAAISSGTPAIVVAATGRARARKSALETARILEARGVEPMIIGATPDASLSLHDNLAEWLSPIVAVAAGQVLALRWALVGGHPLDAPRGLTKVTETY